MLSWLFKRGNTEDIAPLYTAIRAEARRPDYFSSPLSVPDSFDGRFELLVLIMHLCLHRLGNQVDGGDATLEADQQRLAKQRSQRLFNRLFDDLDTELRESGFGDSSVPKQIKSMTTGFFGRGQAYEAALNSHQLDDLKSALRDNLYGTVEPTETTLLAMTRHVQHVQAELAALPDSLLMDGDLSALHQRN